ncbi:MAG: T9SS type A sorting domain-containing protein [Winogradskyella sp.]|nr:T9SS type A sorting domain-containing protein [Winogradskyella sp.]
MKKYCLALILLFGCLITYTQTTLAKEDIAIIGVNTDTENFTFLLRVDITTGTEIYFTDNEVNATGTALNNTGEGIVLFTASTNYNCGSVLSFVANSAEFSNVSGSLILNNGGDELLAFQGYNNTDDSWTTFLHANVYDSITFPVGFTAADIVDGFRHNRAYNGNTNNPTWAELNNITNYNEGNNFSLVTLSTTNFNCAACSVVATWDGTNWNWSDGTPQNTIPTSDVTVIIDGAYDTSAGAPQTSFSACSITVNTNNTLTIGNNSYIEIQNDIVVNGDITVERRGSVVQIDDNASTSGSGNIIVQKNTALLNTAFEYTYWSSPVSGETIEDTFSNVTPNRRYLFNASNFEDLLSEIDNSGNYVPGQDDIDDDGNAWQLASGIMLPGVGYATTAVNFGMFPASQQFTFEGPFNNGVYQPAISNASNGNYNDWNFIGNPYPSAIDTDVFFTVNSGIVDHIYLWSHATPASANASGNEGQNFSGSDYAIISANGVNTAGGSGTIPNNFVPSGQGFFIEALSGTNVTFNNSMRVTGNNGQFFRPSNLTNLNRQVLWLNLTSDNGVFNQIAVAHITGATDDFDGSFYDIRRNISSASAARIYSTIPNDNKEYVIQGKTFDGLNENEVIELGFKCAIETETTFTISLAQFEGVFYNNNSVYLKDNLTNSIHNLKDSDYNFTSEVGEFNDRFEIVFNDALLSVDDHQIHPKALTIVELNNGNVEFKINGNSTIKKVEILDMLGRQVYSFKANHSTEVYNLSKLRQSPYIARVTLSNGQIISKKAVKQK